MYFNLCAKKQENCVTRIPISSLEQCLLPFAEMDPKQKEAAHWIEEVRRIVPCFVCCYCNPAVGSVVYYLLKIIICNNARKQVTGTRIDDFHEDLKSGVVLCE